MKSDSATIVEKINKPLEKKELMIHKFHDAYLDIQLDDYILTFDDGLFSQVLGIRKIVNVYPDIEIKFFVSTGIIHIGTDAQTFNESDVAHQRFFDLGLTTDFVSYDNLVELSKISQVKIGFHGHKHIKPSYLKKNLSLNDRLKTWKDDAREMVFGAVKFYEARLIQKDTKILYCAPYNEIDDLQIAIIRKTFANYFDNEVIVYGPRLDINTFDAAPSFLERYDDVLEDAQKAIINATRVPPRYLGDL